MTSPPPIAALTVRKRRRERSTLVISAPFLAVRRPVRRVLDSLADSHIRTAATNASRHGGVDIAIGRAWLGGEPRRRGHALAGPAIAALRHLQPEPGPLGLLSGGGVARGRP